MGRLHNLGTTKPLYPVFRIERINTDGSLSIVSSGVAHRDLQEAVRQCDQMSREDLRNHGVTTRYLPIHTGQFEEQG